jgi:hypothetical protein
MSDRFDDLAFLESGNGRDNRVQLTGEEQAK